MWFDLRQRLGATDFLGYATEQAEGPVIALLKTGALAGGMRPKVEACIRAATGGMERTHIIDGRIHDSLLLEVFTGSGSGTMIVGRKEKATYLGVDLADGDRAS